MPAADLWFSQDVKYFISFLFEICRNTEYLVPDSLEEIALLRVDNGMSEETDEVVRHDNKGVACFGSPKVLGREFVGRVSALSRLLSPRNNRYLHFSCIMSVFSCGYIIFVAKISGRAPKAMPSGGHSRPLSTSIWRGEITPRIATSCPSTWSRPFRTSRSSSTTRAAHYCCPT